MRAPDMSRDPIRLELASMHILLALFLSSDRLMPYGETDAFRSRGARSCRIRRSSCMRLSAGMHPRGSPPARSSVSTGRAWPRRASRGIPSPGSGGRKATIRVPPGGKLPCEADWRLARRQSAPRGRAHVPVVLACLLRYYADLPVFSLVRVRRCSGLAR
jgi:hypothetical protein